jgi:nucleotide-binding universal stress UspA family protein
MTVNRPTKATVFETIVVGVDGREGGRDALSLAVRLADMSGASLVAVRNMSAGPPPFVKRSVQDARTQLADEVAYTGHAARVRVLGESSPARALHRVAEEDRAGLIVVGSTRRGVAGRLLAGDHAVGTLHASPCPVAVAPLGFAGREWPAMTRIGVGFDGRAESRHALDFAVALARACDATIKVRSVIGSPLTEGEDSVYDPDWLEQARAWAAEELAQALRGIDADVSGRVLAGVAVDALADFSAHVDLLVIGSRGWGPIRRVLVGSTAARLMREAHGPLLVVPCGVATGEPGEPEVAAPDLRPLVVPRPAAT